MRIANDVNLFDPALRHRSSATTDCALGLSTAWRTSVCSDEALQFVRRQNCDDTLGRRNLDVDFRFGLEIHHFSKSPTRGVEIGAATDLDS
jgi:hypothetical protein